LNTEEIIQKCKQNHYSAQIEVYNSFKNLLFSASYRILNNREDAEDIVQDAFIHGFEKINQLNDDGNIGAWFRRIAINKSLDLIRKRKKVFWLEEKQELQQVEETNEVNFTGVSIDFIKNCINQLKEKYRIIVVLYMIEDYTHREIGEMLQINESTVRNQYKRGKDKLLLLLKNQ